ncbi:hypothetical protein [Pedobacter sp. SYSU D00535]|uniref:hypothetical protein n=1 Tax=Pedobacter sp. SYSU D00535 TaxID=2810308 RepID=UPI001A959A99|nr:hypothetical protein [Pedobacter sp. SYSU D00535]
MSTSPSLAKVRRELGDDGNLAIKAILTILLEEVINFLNVGKTMNDRQIATTINLIIDDYSQLKPDDFKLCFKNGMKGKYGKSYDRLDGNVIFEWLEQYLYEKESEIEMIRRNENSRLKRNSDFAIGQEGTTMPDWFKMPDKKQSEIKSSEPRKMSDEQRLFNELINRFDGEFKRRGVESGGGRFVKFYGRMMNVEEYVNFKAAQIDRIIKLDRFLTARSKRK